MDKPETNVITFNYEKDFRDRGSGFMNEIFPKGSAWMYGEFMKLSETMFKNIQWS